MASIPERCANVRQNLSIVDYLYRKGHQPQSYSREKGDVMFLSPLRAEKTASFCVHTRTNRYWDFGTMSGGSVIDLALADKENANRPFAEVLEELERLIGYVEKPDLSKLPSHSHNFADKEGVSAHVDNVVPIHTIYSLVNYLKKRGIDPEVAEKAGAEVVFYHNTSHTGQRFGIGFKQDGGNYEIRSPYFKGSPFGKKTISTVEGEDKMEWKVFEGFFDYLSFRQMRPDYKGSAVILNSTALLGEGLERLKALPDTPPPPPLRIGLYLDNDSAGDEATRTLHEELSKKPYAEVEDHRPIYSHHNDLNDYLLAMQQKKAQEKKAVPDRKPSPLKP